MQILNEMNEPSVIVVLSKSEIKNLLLDLESKSIILRNSTADIKDKFAQFLISLNIH